MKISPREMDQSLRLRTAFAQIFFQRRQSFGTMASGLRERFSLLEIVPRLMIVQMLQTKNGEIIFDDTGMGIEFVISFENFFCLIRSPKL